VEGLGINWPGLVSQLINFTLLLVLLRMVAYKPIIGMLDRRQARIRESLEKAAQIDRDAAAAKGEFAAQLDQARREGQTIIAQASQIAERLRQETQEQARREAEQFLVEARAQIERDRERASAELRVQVADMVIMAAGKVLERDLDRSAHYALIDEVLSDRSKLS
jgi:F-type H+-transporting ATPase subunit b